MQHEIKSRYNGTVRFVADIDCDESASDAEKRGAAALWALENDANLAGASLARANLAWASLARADLARADLARADLAGASLARANIAGVDLAGANLAWASLAGANIAGANFAGADIAGANLAETHGVNDYIKCIQIDEYPIAYTADVLQIGSESHAIEEWRTFDNARIAEMDGKTVLKFWAKYKDWIFQTIELCPAKPTKEA